MPTLAYHTFASSYDQQTYVGPYVAVSTDGGESWDFNSPTNALANALGNDAPNVGFYPP